MNAICACRRGCDEIIDPLYIRDLVKRSRVNSIEINRIWCTMQNSKSRDTVTWFPSD